MKSPLNALTAKPQAPRSARRACAMRNQEDTVFRTMEDVRREVRIQSLVAFAVPGVSALSLVAQAPPSADTFVSSTSPPVNYGPRIASEAVPLDHETSRKTRITFPEAATGASWSQRHAASTEPRACCRSGEAPPDTWALRSHLQISGSENVLGSEIGVKGRDRYFGTWV
jgi:hypothetical protein